MGRAAAAVALAMLAPLARAQAPGNLRLQLEDIGIGDGADSMGTFDADPDFTGNEFTVSGTYSDGPRASARFRFTMDVANPALTAVAAGGGLATLTPRAEFRGTLTFSGTGAATSVSAAIGPESVGNAQRSCPNPQTASSTTFTCSLPVVGHLTVSGRNRLRLRTVLSMGLGRLEVEALYSYEQLDSLEIVPGSLLPNPPQLRGDRVTFSARAKYTFTTFAAAWVALRLYDQPAGGNLLGSSDLVAATRPTGENVLTIADFPITDTTPTTVYLQCVLINRATEAVVLRTPPIAVSRPPKIGVAPVALQLTGVEPGKATATSVTLDVSNAGGGELNWRFANTTVNLAPTGNAVGTVRVRVAPAQATGVAARQITRVTVEADTSQVTRAGVFTGTLTLDSTVADSVSVPVEVAVTEPVGEDIVTLSGVIPGPGSLPFPSDQRFTAVVRYTLVSARTGSVALELRQGAGVIRRSDAVAIESGTNEVGLVIPEFALPDVSQLTLRGVLRTEFASVESSPITYNLRNDSVEVTGVSGPLLAGESAGAFIATLALRLTSGLRSKLTVTLATRSGAVVAREERTGLRPTVARFDLRFAPFAVPAAVEPLVLTASLVDEASGAVLTSSGPFPAPVEAAPTVGIQLGVYNFGEGEWRGGNLQAGLRSPDVISGWPDRALGGPAARIVWDRGEPSRAYVEVFAVIPGRNLPVSLGRRGNEERGIREAFAYIPNSPLPLGTTALEFEGMIEIGAHTRKSPRLNVPVETVHAKPDGMPARLRIGPPAQGFKFRVTYQTNFEVFVALHRVIRIVPAPPGSNGGVLDQEVRNASAGTERIDEFNWMSLPSGTTEVTVQYVVRRISSGEEMASSAVTTFRAFEHPASRIQRGVDAMIEFAKGQIANAATALGETFITPAVKQKGFDFLEGAGNPLIKTPPRQTSALLAAPAYLGIQRTWEFSPAIPAGAFSGELILRYDSSEFPDHPDFDESKLRIVSVDGAGQVTAWPTILDRANRTASTRLDRLDSAYTLAMPGPFANAVLSAPVALPGRLEQTLALVNSGATRATADPGGVAIAPGRQAVVSIPRGSTAGVGTVGVDVRTSASVAGVALLGGPALESVDLLRTSARVVVVADIVRGADSTEIHLANPTRFAGEARLALWNQDGSSAGVATREIAAKTRNAERVESLFPEMPAAFNGYITAELDPGLSAAAVLDAGGSISILPAQPVPAPSRATTRIQSPYLAAGPAVWILNLVNPTTLDATATVSVLGSGGVALAPSTDIRLAAGRQDRRSLTELLGLDSLGQPGAAIRVDSTISGVVGNVVIEDVAGGSRARTAVPLDLEPARAWIIPYASNAAGLVSTLTLHNTAGAAASARIRVMGPDGAALGEATAPVPGNGGLSGLLSALVAGSAGRTGYVSVTADQPVIPMVLLAPANGAGDIAAILPQPVPGASAPVTPPVTPPTAAPLEFGSVPVGQTRDLVVGVRNNGPATLTIRSYSVSNARFSVVSPAAPFTVAAGTAQALTVRFAPLAVGPQSGTLTLNSDDPALPSVAVPLSGVGADAPPAGAPRIEASPAAVAFDAIAPGGQNTKPLTIRNTGSGALTITALAITGAEFSLVGVTAPVTIAAGSSASWTLRFSAAAAGSYTGTLAITSNDAAGPVFRVPLSGSATGAATAPRIRLSEAALEFGGVRVGATADLTVEILNTGDAPLVVESIQPDNPRFTLPGSGSFTLAPRNAFDLRVVFRPSAAGPQTGVISIRSNDPGSPTRITVSGTGQ